MHTSKFTLLSLSLGLMLAAGCSRTSTDTTPPEPAMTEASQPEPVATPAPEPIPEPTPVVEEPPAPPPLTDGEIVAIAVVVNDAEVEHAKLAKTKAKHKRVKEFASMMAKEHADANKREAALVQRAGLSAVESEASRKLSEDAKTRGEALKDVAKGAEFDRAYMQHQVEVHTMVLDMLTNQMVPAAQNAELKAEVEALRGSVEAHLGQAKEILEVLNQPTA